MTDLLSTAARNDGADCWTLREIMQQPRTLGETARLLDREREALDAFLSPLLARAGLRIILAGAGTSAFIGECIAPWLSKTLGVRFEAIPTTDIVSAPGLYLERATPTLLVSFGRSGSSPESIAAVDLANARIDDVHHLIITCNGEGALARNANAQTHVLVLPEATHDRGFAMTSSFSAMMLAALATFAGRDGGAARWAAIGAAVEAVLADADQPMRALAGRGFTRVVYLGSGVFKGLAREAALKLLELTDGQLVTAFDSPMGFRHGPKTIVNDRTLVVVFVSNDPLTGRYDRDLLAELQADGVAGAVAAVSARGQDGDAIVVPHLAEAQDVDLLFPYIVPAQLFALHASLAHGMTPDTPNAAGTVNRVVQGVRIHAVGA